jgi:hypothetical protein
MTVDGFRIAPLACPLKKSKKILGIEVLTLVVDKACKLNSFHEEIQTIAKGNINSLQHALYYAPKIKGRPLDVACCALLLKECPQHQRHKGDPGVTSRTCVMFGEGTQLDIVLDKRP